MSNLQTRPLDIAIERATGSLRVNWADGHTSTFALRWLRANCPCATCREDVRVASDDPLALRPMPSSEVESAELVGNYALRLQWKDGHNAGIYTFSSLRASCPCSDCNPNGPPPLFLAA